MRGHLDARDEIALLDDLTVEDREHLERVEPVDPLEFRDPHGDDAVHRGHEVEPALVRAADVESRPAIALAKRRAASSSCSSLPVGDEHGHRRTGLLAGKGQQVVGGSRRPFDQRFPPTVRSRVRTAPASRAGARRPGVTRSTRNAWTPGTTR